MPKAEDEKGIELSCDLFHDYICIQFFPKGCFNMSAMSSFRGEEKLDYIKLVCVQHHLGKKKIFRSHACCTRQRNALYCNPSLVQHS